jgi:hypothetical protein
MGLSTCFQHSFVGFSISSWALCLKPKLAKDTNQLKSYVVAMQIKTYHDYLNTFKCQSFDFEKSFNVVEVCGPNYL